MPMGSRFLQSHGTTRVISLAHHTSLHAAEQLLARNRLASKAEDSSPQYATRAITQNASSFGARNLEILAQEAMRGAFISALGYQRSILLNWILGEGSSVHVDAEDCNLSSVNTAFSPSTPVQAALQLKHEGSVRGCTLGVHSN
jgi:hypothetical protein